MVELDERVGPRHRRCSNRRGRAWRDERIVSTILFTAMLTAVGVGVAQAGWSVHASRPASERLADPQLRIQVGAIVDLAPGMPQPMSLTVTNDDGAAVRITSVEATVGSLPTGCPATAFVVVPNLPLPTVDGGETVEVPVQLSLALDAPPVCQDLHLPLALRVSGAQP